MMLAEPTTLLMVTAAIAAFVFWPTARWTMLILAALFGLGAM